MKIFLTTISALLLWQVCLAQKNTSSLHFNLSLSYDIIKAHGGEIKVETKEGEGSEFVIQLPIV